MRRDARCYQGEAVRAMHPWKGSLIPAAPCNVFGVLGAPAQSTVVEICSGGSG
jgi:hypothetical protein